MNTKSKSAYFMFISSMQGIAVNNGMIIDSNQYWKSITPIDSEYLDEDW